MYQIVILYLADLIMPNAEKDTPLRWLLRFAVLGLLGIAFAKLA